MHKRNLLHACLLLSTLNGCMGTEKATPTQEGPTMQTTASGLKYTILKEAPQDADVAKSGSVVSVHYTGWLDEKGQPGTKFDSSVDRKQPFQFFLGMGQVIKGWDEGVVGMKVGEKRRLVIPANLGYGTRGAGALIPGNATLIFDVELLEILTARP